MHDMVHVDGRAAVAPLVLDKFPVEEIGEQSHERVGDADSKTGCPTGGGADITIEEHAVFLAQDLR